MRRLTVAACAPAVVVREATAADVAELVPVWRQMMAEHAARHAAFTLADDAAERWRNDTTALLGRRDAFVLVACLARSAVGLCVGWAATNPAIYQTRRVGLLSELAVTPAARRCGVGRALVAEAYRWFGARALEEFQLSTAVDNAAGRAFWRAMGGEELLVRFRFNLGDDAAAPGGRPYILAPERVQRA